MYSSFCLTWARSLVFPGEIGPADEFSARLDIEVDSPGPSHVIKCVPIRARSGTARVHAPKDLQVYKHLYSFTNFYTKKTLSCISYKSGMVRKNTTQQLQKQDVRKNGVMQMKANPYQISTFTSSSWLFILTLQGSTSLPLCFCLF